jgi:hypothetical protein
MNKSIRVSVIFKAVFYKHGLLDGETTLYKDLEHPVQNFEYTRVYPKVSGLSR